MGDGRRSAGEPLLGCFWEPASQQRATPSGPDTCRLPSGCAHWPLPVLFCFIFYHSLLTESQQKEEPEQRLASFQPSSSLDSAVSVSHLEGQNLVGAQPPPQRKEALLLQPLGAFCVAPRSLSIFSGCSEGRCCGHGAQAGLHLPRAAASL